MSRLHSTRSGSHKLAFTLIEVLVVITIIGILIAVLLPAVQAAREAARRMLCTNNLKQIGLALQTYHDAFKSLPPAALYHSEIKNGIPTGNMDLTSKDKATWGWSVLILPFIEQRPLYDQLKPLQRSLEDVLNDPAATRLVMTPIPVYLCPSAKSPPLNDKHLFHTSSGSVIRAGTSNYPGCAGTNWKNGVIVATIQPKNTAIRYQDIADGTSFVFAVGERRWGEGKKDDKACVWPGVDNPTTPKLKNWPGHQLYVAGMATERPNFSRGRHNGFSSEHPGGLNFLFCDGSVHFISDLIESKQGVKLNANNTKKTISWTPFKAPQPPDYTPPGIYQLLAVRDDGWPIKVSF